MPPVRINRSLVVPFIMISPNKSLNTNVNNKIPIVIIKKLSSVEPVVTKPFTIIKSPMSTSRIESMLRCLMALNK